MYILKHRIIKVLVVSAVACLVYLLWISPLRPFGLISLKIIDGFHLISNSIRPLDDTVKKIVVVLIDDESLDKVGLRWPWSRGLLAQMLEKISADKPVAVCLDLVFFGNSVSASDDTEVAKVIKDAGNIIIGSYLGTGGKGLILDDTIAAGAKASGFINKPQDVDDIVRRASPALFSTSRKIIGYSLAAQMAAYISNKTAKEITSKAPILRDGSSYIRYFGGANKFVLIPAWKVLKNETKPGTFNGKMVFVGSSSGLLHDNHQTPLGLMPGVIIIANETLGFLTGKFLYCVSSAMNFIIMFIFLFAITLILLTQPFERGIVASLAGTSIFLALGFALFLKGVIVDPFGGVFLIISATVFVYGKQNFILVLENIRLREAAITDGLTGLYIYRYFKLQINSELKKANAEKKPLSLIIYDVDHFKEINDKYGHESGNVILKTASKIIKESVRNSDTVARYGGDEFCVLMPNATGKIAKMCAQRALENLRAKTSLAADIANVTMSVGIVSLEDYATEDPVDLIKAADSALYESKKSGRDRVTVFNKTNK